MAWEEYPEMELDVNDADEDGETIKGGRGSWRFRPLAPTGRVGGGRK